jgi:hypothetical protein
VGDGIFFSFELGGGLLDAESSLSIGSVLCCSSYGSDEEHLELSMCSESTAVVTEVGVPFCCCS